MSYAEAEGPIPDTAHQGYRMNGIEFETVWFTETGVTPQDYSPIQEYNAEGQLVTVSYIQTSLLNDQNNLSEILLRQDPSYAELLVGDKKLAHFWW